MLRSEAIQMLNQTKQYFSEHNYLFEQLVAHKVNKFRAENNFLGQKNSGLGMIFPSIRNLTIWEILKVAWPAIPIFFISSLVMKASQTFGSIIVLAGLIYITVSARKAGNLKKQLVINESEEKITVLEGEIFELYDKFPLKDEIAFPLCYYQVTDRLLYFLNAGISDNIKDAAKEVMKESDSLKRNGMQDLTAGDVLDYLSNVYMVR